MGNAGGMGYAVALTGTEILMDYPSSIILPAKNEAGNLGPVLAQLAARFPAAAELLV
jgi:hypothetical protein